jgi:hypothetical protein
MDTTATPVRSVRKLYSWEIEQARLVFQDGLNYDVVRIHEGVSWPDWIDKIGRRLKRMEPNPWHNAITLGNSCFFPVILPRNFAPPDNPDHGLFCWLIHELTHVWQYQKFGWRYLFQAVKTQLGEKAAAYDFGSKEGLKMHRKDGWTFTKFNPEQQGDIVRSYYDRLSKGKDISDWEPYIQELRSL